MTLRSLAVDQLEVGLDHTSPLFVGDRTVPGYDLVDIERDDAIHTRRSSC